MRLLILFVLSICLLLLLEKPLKKHAAVFYFGAVIIGGAGYMAQLRLPDGMLKTIVSDYLISGTLPAVLFVLVMYAAVFPKKSRIYRCAMSCRGEIAIGASFLALAHMVYYGYIIRSGNLIALVIELLLIALLVPLTLTSFKKIRRKMNAKAWKKLQRWSYFFYGLLYLHVVIMIYPKAVRGDFESLIDLCIYTAMFGIYLGLRFERYLEKKKKQSYCPAVWSSLLILFAAASFGLNYSMVYAKGTDERPDPEYYSDGVWEGEGMGLNGAVRVKVVVEEGNLTDIKILEHEDDEPYFSDAKQEIIPAIIENQSVDVDGVSGATFSSEGIIEAVKDALMSSEEQD